ncbi:MAG: hypothetical protein A3F47_02255 [Candidatus Staskawiczbacteria bacterium RIFCSPHIGHO2_12_FULL_38_11]|uniref:Uncharacterized protein n=1 Tax=Candidatus Staskawiczbacteria bacterium RIFCSPHIGHO2_12_FULL_38_11 TaxID=1802209 RepID=A0A1G2I4C7_9BACT|nr:MAG: hypothetical protein A3F47_02255 [Candidatus Staskawiczbacteria bacterium RIFCSPHIGHO2_12_FULL_38_11]
MSRIKKSRSKNKSKPARLERRVRVTFFLVANQKEHFDAIDDIRDYLKQQYLEDEKERELPVTGFTHSLFPGSWPFPSGEPVFTGYWWYTSNKKDKVLTIEKTALFLIDFPAYAEEWKTDENISLLKNRIFECYERYHCPQDEIWIVKQDIYLYA